MIRIELTDGHYFESDSMGFRDDEISHYEAVIHHPGGKTQRITFGWLKYFAKRKLAQMFGLITWEGNIGVANLTVVH